MDRMGHSTTRAAMAYLHGSDERQQAIADALSSRAAAELGRVRDDAIGHATGTNGQPGYWVIDLRFWSGRIRTRDPLLRRHLRTVAGRRLASLYEPSSSRYCG
jgi:hypothetical protein